MKPTPRFINSHGYAPLSEELPHWDEISAKTKRGEALTPLELFVYDNEPAGDEDIWRDQLAAALASAPVAGEAQPVAEVVSRYGDPEAFGERDLKVLVDLNSYPYGTKFFAAPQASEAECSCPSGNGSLRHPCAVHPTGGEAVRQPACHVGHPNFTPFYLLANLRRICTPSLARRENWVLAIELFAVGGTTARRICREAGIDPDGKTVIRAARSTQPGAQKEQSDA